MLVRLLRTSDPRNLVAPAVVLGSLGWVGFAPALRGTAGTAVTALLAYALKDVLNPMPLGWWLAAGVAALASLGVAQWAIASGHARGDPSWFVLDESAGYLSLLALLGRPELSEFCLAFMAFRIYDLAKPWPVSSFEGLPGGIGILADDLAAAVMGFWTIGCVSWFVKLGLVQA